MADTENEDQPAPAPAPTTFEQTVDEFCANLSKTDKRPELIYAFAKSEKREGRVKDFATNFSSRYAAFAAKPVS